MDLFEIGDLIQKRGTGDVGIVIERCDIFDPICFPYPLDYPYGGMGRTSSTLKPRTTPGYKVETFDGKEIWEHREVRLITPKPLDDL